MSKFVCDYAQVSAAGDKVIEAANELLQATSTYSSNMSQDISGWSGEAKTTFASQSSDREQVAVSQAKRMSEFGEFIKEASSKIEELDENLAGIQI